MDEIIGGDADDVEIAACAVDEDTMDLMRACYAHVPDRKILPNEVSRENSAVAAGSSTENISKGVGTDMELKDATAEQIRQENPTVAQTIAEEAIQAERTRVREITALTRKGEKWQAMARKAIEEGTSVADYLKAIIAEEAKQGEEYLNTRREELQAANQVGAGDSKDNDGKDAEAKADQVAKEIAEIAKSMNANSLEMA